MPEYIYLTSQSFDTERLVIFTRHIAAISEIKLTDGVAGCYVHMSGRSTLPVKESMAEILEYLLDEE
jgi:hypothetical protein